jgi:sRNA-binding protein
MTSLSLKVSLKKINEINKLSNSVIVQKERNKKIALELQDLYPIVFCKKNPLPLAVGVHKEIMISLPQYSEKNIKNALCYWTLTKAYLKAIKFGDYRFNLQAETICALSHEDREYSERLLKQKKIVRTNKLREKNRV